MSLFRSIVFAALFAGVLTGFVTSGLQLLGTTPLILQAETYETAAATADPAEAGPAGHHGEQAAAHHHHDDGAAWAPHDAFERTSATVLANILTAFGSALLLTGLMSVRGRPVDWREGLLWGLGGFACVMLAPSIGLPPALPGAPELPLAERQAWWLATAVLTACGLGLISFVRRPWAIAAALVAIAAPHVFGAPTAPDGGSGLVPSALASQFTAAALITSLASWAMLGVLSGHFLQRGRT